MRTLARMLLLVALLGTAFQPGVTQPAAAQGRTPAASASSSWQETATGLLGTARGRKMTAGLGFTVRQDNWPRLSMNGGVKDGSTFQWSNAILGPVGIDLGQISVPGTSGAFTAERANWAHNAMTFTFGGQPMTVVASRLSAALLVQSPANALRVLTGPVQGHSLATNGVTERAEGPALPKYAAFAAGGGAQVATLSTSTTPLSLSSNWLLVWYGTNSHFVDTKKPLSYAGLAASHAYQGDVPILLIFQNKPTAIKQASEGGVELTFGGGAGYVAVLPLFGRNIQNAAQTSGWASSLPANVRQRAEWWATRLCDYPVNAAETYAYDDSADVATVTEAISFVQVCSGGTRFAPIPPMLSIAKDALGVSFSGAVVDGNLPTEFGPSLGLDNTQTYSWRLQGLKQYVDGRRQIGSQTVPQDVEQELTDQVNKVVAAGHVRPWIFLDGVPRHASRGDLYWSNPADALYQLVQVAEALPSGATRQSLVSYIRAERTKYPPETIYKLDVVDGVVRTNFSIYFRDWEYFWKGESEGRPDAIQKRVPLWSFYALSAYHDLTGEAIPAGLMQRATQVLDQDMREQDWATSYWFDGFQDRATAVVNANRHFAGLLGYARLARRASDAATLAQVMPLVAKAAASRVAMAKYPRYLYAAGLQDLPPGADWMLKQTRHTWTGYLFNANWATGDDDARQVTLLTQYGVVAYDHSGTQGGDGNDCCFPFAYLTAYRDLVPELARLLTDRAKSDAEVYARKVKALVPHWYAAFGEGIFGHEHNLNHPVDSYQTFLAEAWISGAPASDLARYADIPWLELGDLFYMHKLAESIKAYRGIKWDNTVLRVNPKVKQPGRFSAGDTVQFQVTLEPFGAIDNMVFVTSSVPAELQYVTGSLGTDPSNVGSTNDTASPTLVWQGTLDQPVTVNFSTKVLEQRSRVTDVTVVVEDKPGKTQTYRISVVLNGIALFLPSVIRFD